MVMKRNMEDGEAEHRNMTEGDRLRELRRSTGALKHVLTLAKDHGDEEDVAAIAAARELLFASPLDDVFMSMTEVELSPEMAVTMMNQSRRRLYALAPLITRAYLAKATDENAPGSIKVLSELMKGLGLLTPGAPMDDEQREKTIQRKDLADLSDDELDEMLGDD
jgi:hypothetical protein